MWNKYFQKCHHLFIIYKSIIWQPCCEDVQGAELSEMDLYICKYVINKWHFCKVLSLNSYCLFSKHLDTKSNVTNCGTGQTDLWANEPSIIYLCAFRLDTHIGLSTSSPINCLILQDFFRIVRARDQKDPPELHAAADNLKRLQINFVQKTRSSIII